MLWHDERRTIQDGKYTEGPWEGRLVTDPELEIDIIKWLKSEDKLFKKIKINHDYPHCWRCKSALISYPKPAWYIATTKYKDVIVNANRDINWYPSYVGEKRFANWFSIRLKADVYVLTMTLIFKF